MPVVEAMMIQEDFEASVKIVVVGNGGVGKTSLIQQFCKGEFTENYKKTIGVDFLEKQWTVESSGQDVTLLLWDTAGQEEFNSITRSYYRGAGGAIVVFSTTDRQSFLDVQNWIGNVTDECGNIPVVVVQNKVDLIDESVVHGEEANELARTLSVQFFRTSVKTNFNVEGIFDYLAEEFLNSDNNGVGSGVATIEELGQEKPEEFPSSPTSPSPSVGDLGEKSRQPEKKNRGIIVIRYVSKESED